MISDWLVALLTGRDEWSCSSQDSGGQCVMTLGPDVTLKLFAGSWDTQQMVIPA